MAISRLQKAILEYCFYDEKQGHTNDYTHLRKYIKANLDTYAGIEDIPTNFLEYALLQLKSYNVQKAANEIFGKFGSPNSDSIKLEENDVPKLVPAINQTLANIKSILNKRKNDKYNREYIERLKQKLKQCKYSIDAIKVKEFYVRWGRTIFSEILEHYCVQGPQWYAYRKIEKPSNEYTIDNNDLKEDAEKFHMTLADFSGEVEVVIELVKIVSELPPPSGYKNYKPFSLKGAAQGKGTIRDMEYIYDIKKALSKCKKEDDIRKTFRYYTIAGDRVLNNILRGNYTLDRRIFAEAQGEKFYMDPVTFAQALEDIADMKKEMEIYTKEEEEKTKEISRDTEFYRGLTFEGFRKFAHLTSSKFNDPEEIVYELNSKHPILSDPGFLSVSKSEDIADDFARFENAVILTIKVKSGTVVCMDISGISHLPYEEEVLLVKNQKLKVLSAKLQPDPGSYRKNILKIIMETVK